MDNNTFWNSNHDRDKKRKQYLDKINHAPYGSIFFLFLGLLVVFTGLVVVGSF
jgi:hypothetical protein